MPIISSGLGFTAPIIAFAIVVLCQTGIDQIMGEGYFKSNNLPQIITCIIISQILWFLGKALNKPTKKEMGDLDPEFPIKVKAKHSLFFIPYQYYGPISLIYGSFYMFIL